MQKRLGFTRPQRLLTQFVALGVVGAMVMAPALSSGAASKPTGSTLDIADVISFSGPNSFLGAITIGPCDGAVNVINAAGGVLGHKLSCIKVDDLGDPADAVANVSKALATNRSIIGAIGVPSATAATEVPILNAAKITMVSQAGLSLFSNKYYKYFWRMTPPDVFGGVAMGLAAASNGEKKVAVIIQNDVGDTGNTPGIVSALKKKHVSLVSNVTVPSDATSYETTINKIVNLHPDGLIISADNQTTETLLAEYQSLSNGKVPATILSTQILGGNIFPYTKKSLGLSFATKKLSLVGTYVNETTPQFKVYDAAVKATPGGTKLATAIVATQAIGTIYDGIITMALAMQAANSMKPVNFNSYMSKVATKRAGAVEVNSFAQGVKALKAGHKIYYVGVTGPIVFDKFHNSGGEFATFQFTANGNVKSIKVFPPSVTKALAP
ncbi:MAG TPA: ABC transporter substrate-binding protein [Acidimicrobiales bacterium]|nr:ABC transporter substrate-binding protein [Acidimicrobiales bacterium]